MIDLVLKKSKERSLLRRHPWVYDTAVQKVVLDSKKTAPASGETVRVVSFDGRFLAWAAYSPESTIRARCWSFKEEEVIDASWFEKKLRHAVEARACLRDRTSAVRLVFGEADGLPGLIVDQYADCLVTQFQSAGVEAHRELIADLLMEITGAKTIFDRSDAATRQREGLPIRSELLRGEEPPAAIEVVEDGVRYGVDVRVGHKTGFYVDQRESRLTAQKVAEEFRRVHGRGMRALNCFCYTGGFSVYALSGGAKEVCSVDSSERAVALAAENMQLNFGDSAAHSEVAADAVEYLKDIGDRYDLIILDPPAFAKHHKVLGNAMQGYKRLNARALSQIRPGGILFTFSCSQAVTKELFRTTVFSAAAIAGRKVRILHQLTQPADHPINIYHPEGEYLKGLVLYVE